MHIAIINCDYVAAKLAPQFGQYPDMFMRSLNALTSGLKFTIFDALSRELPPLTSEFDGYLITGSRYNAYDNDPWIELLLGWIQQTDQQRRPLAGICFGHQLIARALGATVSKSAKGWGLGSALVTIEQTPSWLINPPKQLRLWVSHQDQVQTLPPQCQCLAGNSFCPFFMLFKDTHILTIQGHPEFNQSYTYELAKQRREQVNDSQWARITDSLHYNIDSEVVLNWILHMFRAQ